MLSMSRGVWRGQVNLGIAASKYKVYDYLKAEKERKPWKRNLALAVRKSKKYRHSAGMYERRPWTELERCVLYMPGYTERQIAFALNRSVLSVQKARQNLKRTKKVPSHAEIVETAKRVWESLGSKDKGV